MLSGMQHFMFCPRQWALIHIEQVWSDNLYTAEGELIHKHVDDPFYRPRCKDKLLLRKMPLASKKLGVYGFADVVECEKTNSSDKNSIYLIEENGYFVPTPIEYKRGRPKHNDCDIIQVVAQAMCMEEMYNIEVRTGAIYYAAIKRRDVFDITNELRSKAMTLSIQMHEMFNNDTVPSAKYKREKCQKCSLLNICMPSSFTITSVELYLKENLDCYEEAT